MTNDSKSLLCRFIDSEYNYVLLKFDRNSRLIYCEGNAGYFGLDKSDIVALPVEEILPFIVGADLSNKFTLHYVEFLEGIVTNVFLYPDEDGFHVIIVDTGLAHDMQQEVQQQANENAILHYRLQQLDAQLQKVNQRLLKANQAKSEFITTASHELKTPLSSILGYAEILQNNLLQQDDLKSAANTIITNGNYLLSLIDNLLEQGRIEYSDTTIKRHSSDLTSLTQDVEKIIKPLATKKSLEFKIQYKVTDDVLLLLDEQHVRQVLINLLTNAIKFTDSGHVALSVYYTDSILKFSVEDTGIGIKKSQLQLIMQPFQRADQADSIEGIGLGLSVSRKLIELMGGELKIDSEYGSGTTVTFTIPAVLATDRLGITTLESKKKPTILLIDDDEDLNDLFSHLLSTEGYPVYTAHTAKEGLRASVTYSPELILLDHNLDGEDGIDVARELITTGYNGKIIMMTAASDQSLVDRATAAGCVDFLKKPVLQQHLLEMLSLHGF